MAANWPYDVNPATYIQQATQTPLHQLPWFRTRYAAPPPQETPLRQQLMQVFGNALMSQQQFPQLVQSLMQNPAYSRGQLGLLASPTSYSPDQSFWRINWNINPSTGASANTSSASGGNEVYGTVGRPMNTGGSFDGGSANGATGAAGAGSSQGGEAGSVGASVGGNSDAGGAASGVGGDSGTY